MTHDIGICFGTLPPTPEARQRTLDDMAGVGFTRVRASANWNALESRQGVINVAGVQTFATWCSDRGMKFLPVGGFTPRFYAPAPNLPPQAAFYSAWRRYWHALVAALVEVGVYEAEVWNEPNIAEFWQRPSATVLAKLSLIAHEEARAVSPKFKLLVGSTAPASNRLATGHKVSYYDESQTYVTVRPVEFFKALFDHGVAPAVGAISCHPYMGNRPATDKGVWSTMQDQWDDIVALATAHGLGAAKVWSTEFGYRTGPSGYANAVTEARQAELLVGQIEEFARRPAVGPAFVFNWQDLGGTSINAFLGIHRYDGSPKPAVAAIREVLAA